MTRIARPSRFGAKESIFILMGHMLASSNALLKNRGAFVLLRFTFEPERTCHDSNFIRGCQTIFPLTLCDFLGMLAVKKRTLNISGECHVSVLLKLPAYFR